MASGRSNARIVRFGVLALVLIGCIFLLSNGSLYNPPSAQAPSSNANQLVDAHPVSTVPPTEPVDLISPQTPAQGVSKEKRIKATFVSLARNSDLYSLLDSIKQIEDRFNSKFHYDWVFLNDNDFDEDFKKFTTRAVSGTTKYGKIPKEQWDFPSWIDKEKAALVREKMREKKIIYGDSVSYRHMCRYESGFFWRHKLLDEYDYYWRVEPDIKIFCDIDFDVFEFMADNNKEYGFTITLPEYKETIETLWDTVKQFTQDNPQYVAKDNLMGWISSDEGQTYNGCHFWSNFEVASLKFWRSEAYTKFFDYLDQAGGFFYERWGDAPVHSIAVALFMDRSKVHFFDNVGYYHVPFNNCPVDPDVRLKHNCVCKPNDDFTWRPWSCTPRYYVVQELERPKGWEEFST